MSGAAAVALYVSVAEAQYRPSTAAPRSQTGSSAPQSGAGSGSGSRSGGDLPAEVTGQRPNAPRAPQTDIFDMRDRAAGAEMAPANTVPASKIESDEGGQQGAGAIVCEAGCDGPPGKVIYLASAAEPAPGMLQPAALTARGASPEPLGAEAIVCVAGCYDEPAWHGNVARPVRKDKPGVVVASVDGALPPLPQASRRFAQAKPRPAPRPTRTAVKPNKSLARLANHVARPVPAPARLTVDKSAERRSVAAIKRRPIARTHSRHRIVRPVAPPARLLPRMQPLPIYRYTEAGPAAPLPLALASNDWFNKAKRDDAPVTSVAR